MLKRPTYLDLVGENFNPLNKAETSEIPLQGKERNEELIDFISLNLVEAICSGQPRPQVVYLYGDLGVGKSTFLANIANFVNKNFFVKSPKDIIENPPEDLGYVNAMAILVKSTPKSPTLWFSEMIKGIGYELPNSRDTRHATWYLKELVEKIYENTEENLRLALRNKDEVISKRLGDEQISEEVKELTKSVRRNPEAALVELCDNLKKIEDFFGLFTLSNCLCVLLLDQIEIEGYTAQNFNLLARLVKTNKNVLLILSDNVEARHILGYPGGRQSKTDASVQNLMTHGQIYTMRGIKNKKDFKEILNYWLPNKNPFSNNATNFLVIEAGNVPRLFLDLSKKAIDEAALDRRKTISVDYLQKMKEKLNDVKLKYRQQRSSLITITAVTPELIKEELDARDEE